MKTSIFVILFVLSVSNAFASHWWIFQIPNMRTLPIEMVNMDGGHGLIRRLQLFRKPDGQICEIRIKMKHKPSSAPNSLFEPQSENLLTLMRESELADPNRVFQFWLWIHSMDPLTPEAVETLETIFRRPLPIY